jgi:hypothetical protein
MSIRDAFRRFRELHEKYKAGKLDDESRARYEADREELARTLLQGQQLAMRPGQSPRQVLRVTRSEKLVITLGPRREGTLTLDIGAGGFSAIIGPLAARIVCEFELYIDGEPMRGRARVVAGTKAPDGSPRTSFAIEQLSDADKKRLETAVFDTALATLPRW